MSTSISASGVRDDRSPRERSEPRSIRCPGPCCLYLLLTRHAESFDNTVILSDPCEMVAVSASRPYLAERQSACQEVHRAARILRIRSLHLSDFAISVAGCVEGKESSSDFHSAFPKT